MADEQKYLVVADTPRAMRWTTIALFALLIVGAIAAVGLAAFLYIQDVQDTQIEEIRLNRALIEKMDREADRTVVLASRTNQLELEARQRELALLLCVLRPGSADCEGVVRNARQLDASIERLKGDIERHVNNVRSEGGGGGSVPPEEVPPVEEPPEPSPEPSPDPPPASPSPHVGNSDQCPPNNPACPDD